MRATPPPAPSFDGLPLCVGVEYLPPDRPLEPTTAPGYLRSDAWLGPDALTMSSRGHASAPAVEAANRERAITPARRTEPEVIRSFWQWSEDELAQLDDPLERTTLMFLHGLMGEDRRRMQRELGMPLLATQHIDVSSRLLESLGDPQAEEEQARYLSRNGNKLLDRPLRRALKNTTFIRDLELILEDFKAENVITSHAYREQNEGGIDWGHVSMRVHPTHYRDPVELTYAIRGLRVGSSASKVKVGWSERLSDDLTLHVRTRHVLGSGYTAIRGDLIWEMSPRTVFAVVAGDDLDFLASSDAYSFFESPMDGTPGVLVYAQTIF